MVRILSPDWARVSRAAARAWWGLALPRLAVADSGGDVRDVPPDASFAVKAASIQQFLAEKGVFPDFLSVGEPSVPDQVIRNARSYTARVSCWR